MTEEPILGTFSIATGEGKRVLEACCWQQCSGLETVLLITHWPELVTDAIQPQEGVSGFEILLWGTVRPGEQHKAYH